MGRGFSSFLPERCRGGLETPSERPFLLFGTGLRLFYFSEKETRRQAQRPVKSAKVTHTRCTRGTTGGYIGRYGAVGCTYWVPPWVYILGYTLPWVPPGYILGVREGSSGAWEVYPWGVRRDLSSSPAVHNEAMTPLLLSCCPQRGDDTSCFCTSG